MLFYGIHKLQNGIDFIQSRLTDFGLPEFIGYGVYVGEIIAPVLIIIGFRTRIAAIVFAVNCLSAILLVQTDQVYSLNPSGGWALELLFIYFSVSTALAFSGGGKLSISKGSIWD